MNARFPHYRILVIDDNPSIHEDFRKILLKSARSGNDLQDMESALFGSGTQTTASTSFEIDCASQGSEGLEMVERSLSEGRPYALAFVDGRMPPGWDGVETISHIWQKYADLQVVLCTAYADYSWQEIQRVLGESDSLLILKKPFDNVEVLQMAHALTRKWELSRQVKVRMENLDDLVRRRTEEKEHTRFLLQAALEHSPAGIIITNANGSVILWTNPAAQRILGCNDTFSMEGGTNDFISGWQALRPDGTPYPNGELPFLGGATGRETTDELEVLLRDAQGQEKFILSNAAPIRDAGSAIVAGIVVFQDITERKASERERERLQTSLSQVQKMESVGLLAGGIAHDYNNMMAVILGSVELAFWTVSPTAPIYETLKTIQKAAKHSADLTQQLLTFARKQTIAPKVLNMNEKVKDTIGMLHRLIGEDIALLWEPNSGLWPVRIDPIQVDQVLINLCINARDAISGIGTIAIAIKNATLNKAGAAILPGIRPGDYIVLSVTDDGRGIEKEHLDRVFEPFFTTKKLGEGTGLGLATVYGIIKQNDGFIYVNSVPGKGSTFTIYLPRFGGEEMKEDVASTKKKKCGRGEIVLIVEDEEAVLTMSKMMLQNLGYKVLTAHTPHEALRVAEANIGKIDLLMSDVVMPEMNGRDLSRRLLLSHPNLKCLFISGYAAEILGDHGILENTVHFLNKPFSLIDLSDKVREALDNDDDNGPDAHLEPDIE